MNSQIPPIPGTMGAQQAKMPGFKRNYYSLRDAVDNAIRFMELGIIFVLPIIVGFYSLKYAAALLIIELSAFYVGMLVCDFDQWYNSGERYEVEADKDLESSPSELDEILDRLSYFENEYPLTIKSMYRYLDRDEIPYRINNLDWLEIVSLLNRLSLTVGKRFDKKDDDESGDDK